MGLPIPVTGEDLCPKCKGKRVARIVHSRGSFFGMIDRNLLIWSDEGHPYVWCELCGGEGTATCALVRVLLK